MFVIASTRFWIAGVYYKHWVFSIDIADFKFTKELLFKNIVVIFCKAILMGFAFIPDKNILALSTRNGIGIHVMVCSNR